MRASFCGWCRQSARNQQGCEVTPGIQCGQIIVATHVMVADKDLWHGPAPGQFEKLPETIGEGIDKDFADLDPFRYQQLLGT
jgi:hypothetical protein